MPRRSEEWHIARERDAFLYLLGYFMGLAATQGDQTIAGVAALLAKPSARAPELPKQGPRPDYMRMNLQRLIDINAPENPDAR